MRLNHDLFSRSFGTTSYTKSGLKQVRRYSQQVSFVLHLLSIQWMPWGGQLCITVFKVTSAFQKIIISIIFRILWTCSNRFVISRTKAMFWLRWLCIICYEKQTINQLLMSVIMCVFILFSGIKELLLSWLCWEWIIQQSVCFSLWRIQVHRNSFALKDVYSSKNVQQ